MESLKDFIEAVSKREIHEQKNRTTSITTETEDLATGESIEGEKQPSLPFNYITD